MLSLCVISYRTKSRTCPPGPELLAKDNCTASRGMDARLNFSIQSFAEIMSSRSRGPESFGGMGSVPFERCRLQTARVLLLNLTIFKKSEDLCSAKHKLIDRDVAIPSRFNEKKRYGLCKAAGILKSLDERSS